MISARALAIAAWLGSASLILGALYFQVFHGLAPCTLCIWQRIPHMLVLVIGLGALAWWPRLGLLCALIILAGSLIAFYHVGIEEGWWQGFMSCTADIGEKTIDEIFETSPVRCDEVAWRFFGISMAAWNGIISLALAILWHRSAR